MTRHTCLLLIADRVFKKKGSRHASIEVHSYERGSLKNYSLNSRIRYIFFCKDDSNDDIILLRSKNAILYFVPLIESMLQTVWAIFSLKSLEKNKFPLNEIEFSVEKVFIY